MDRRFATLFFTSWPGDLTVYNTDIRTFSDISKHQTYIQIGKIDDDNMVNVYINLCNERCGIKYDGKLYREFAEIQKLMRILETKNLEELLNNLEK